MNLQNQFWDLTQGQQILEMLIFMKFFYNLPCLFRRSISPDSICQGSGFSRSGGYQEVFCDCILTSCDFEEYTESQENFDSKALKNQKLAKNFEVDYRECYQDFKKNRLQAILLEKIISNYSFLTFLYDKHTSTNLSSMIKTNKKWKGYFGGSAWRIFKTIMITNTGCIIRALELKLL